MDVTNVIRNLFYVYPTNAASEPIAVFDDMQTAHEYMLQQLNEHGTALKTVTHVPNDKLTLLAIKNTLKANLYLDERHGYTIDNELYTTDYGYCLCINTPYPNYINDLFMVFVSVEKGKVAITDDGDNINEWEMSGFTTKNFKLTAKAKKRIDDVVTTYGLTIKHTDMLTLPLAFVNSNVTVSSFNHFVQAIITLDGLLRMNGK